VKSARVYFAGCAALIGFALSYTLPIYARLPHAYYDPIARRFIWAASAGAIPMGYIGQIGWGLAGAALCALAAFVLVGRREPSERSHLLWAAWALTALVIVMGYFTWNNWP
jgi:hypothetical protein